MAIRIIAVQLMGGVEHQHVIALRWASEESDEIHDSSVEDVMRWLARGPHVAWVGNRNQVATLQLVHGERSSWLQANRMGTLSRELLDLPRRAMVPQPEALLHRR